MKTDMENVAKDAVDDIIKQAIEKVQANDLLLELERHTQAWYD